MIETAFYLCIAILVYIYFIYPLFLYLLSKQVKYSKNIGCCNGYKTKVTIIIPAHNEEAVITNKIKNCFEQDYDHKLLQVIVISDGSTDNTVKYSKETIKECDANIDFKLLEVNERKGKTNIINKAMENVDGELTIFSDANVFLATDAVTNIVYAFADDTVGCVAGQLSYINEDTTATVQSAGVYWYYEEFIKYQESITGSMMGADGSIFAIKTRLFQPLPLYVLDDFCTSMNCIFQGYLLVFDPRVRAFEKSAEKNNEEFRRRVRISNRCYNSFLWMKNSIFAMSFFNVFKFVSHKLLRWYTFLFLLLVFVLNVVGYYLNESTAFQYLLLLQILFYLSALLGTQEKIIRKLGAVGKFCNVTYYFVSANFATMIGIIKSFQGIKTAVWNKAESTR